VGGIDQNDKEQGTDTGRLNSRKSIFGTGTNLQNLQKGPQRQMLIPDEGEEFCHIDLWAAEAFLTALDAQEPKLLGMLMNGEKIHNWMLDKVKERFPDQVIEAHYDYKKAKQNIHSLNYGVEPRKMSEESGLPLDISAWQYNTYHNEFPGIKLRMARIRNQVEKYRTVISFLGRKKFLISPLNRDLLNQCYAWKSQSTIGEITLIAMTKIYYAGKVGPTWIFPALNTHDGLACRVKLGTRPQIEKIVKDCFDIPIVAHDICIRIPVEIGWGRNFQEVIDEKVMWYKMEGEE
jgi:DNA polymerase I-like protein with 3'-5' exonuclease and polymerase domains